MQRLNHYNAIENSADGALAYFHACNLVFEAFVYMPAGYRAAGAAMVTSGISFVPEVRFGQDWYPICGHQFWNNNNGASTICKALGFSSGTLQRGQPYDLDSMEVGLCNPGQPLDACTGGGNRWGPPSTSGWCRKGQDAGITVTCLKEGLPPAQPYSHPNSEHPRPQLQVRERQGGHQQEHHRTLLFARARTSKR